MKAAGQRSPLKRRDKNGALRLAVDSEGNPLHNTKGSNFGRSEHAHKGEVDELGVGDRSKQHLQIVARLFHANKPSKRP